MLNISQLTNSLLFLLICDFLSPVKIPIFWEKGAYYNVNLLVLISMDFLHTPENKFSEGEEVKEHQRVPISQKLKSE
jgi:hypothetical protein